VATLREQLFELCGSGTESEIQKQQLFKGRFNIVCTRWHEISQASHETARTAGFDMQISACVLDEPVKSFGEEDRSGVSDFASE